MVGIVAARVDDNPARTRQLVTGFLQVARAVVGTALRAQAHIDHARLAHRRCIVADVPQAVHNLC